MIFQPPKGTRDFFPEQAITRQAIIDKLRAVFECYGFNPTDSPAFENWAVLSAKGGGGDEIKKQIYYFKDKSGRQLGLRFDLTLSLARMIASKPDIPKPFKRYQIGPVWRYEEVKAGRRYREFWQADADIVGSESQAADAEILAVGVAGLQKLGFEKFTIRLNSRLLLEGLTKKAGIGEKFFLPTCRALDKIDRFGVNVVMRELTQIISKDAIKKLFSLITVKGDNKTILKNFEQNGIDTYDVSSLLEAVKPYGIESYIKVWPALARGLDYYTGPIFEFYIEGREQLGAVAAGGRYDKLIEIFGSRSIPATGLSFGIDRLQTLIKNKKSTKSQLFVAAVKEQFRQKAIEIAQQLRAAGIKVCTDVAMKGLSKQLEYVNKVGIPYTLFVGQKEIESDQFTLRDMSNGKEIALSIQEIIKKIK
jgi:histidyl-tRNA synthetase